MSLHAALQAEYDFACQNEILADQVLGKGVLWDFAQLAWPQIEPDPLVPSWHMEEICAHLAAVSRGELKRLIITIPPGCTKSLLTSVIWPAWDWINNPRRKFMYGTFDVELMRRDANACRRLVRGPWFQQRWGHIVNVDEGRDVQDTQSIFNTTKGGRRVSVTVAGKATGWHAQIQVIDDPTKPKDIIGDPDLARAALERAWNWYRVTMASRRSNPKNFARVIIMQRLHELDLVGRILEEDKKRDAPEYVHLNFPMRAEMERLCKTPVGGDRRTYEGELLTPNRFDEAAVKELEHDLGSQAAAAQLQQRPAPAAGNIFQRDWFTQRWLTLPQNLHLIISADCSFKDSASADFVAIHVWGYCYTDAKYYLIDRIHDRMGLPATVKCIEALAKRWPKARAKLIEDKANGPAVEQTLRGKLSGIIMIEPDGGKIARANAVSPVCEARDVVLPDVGALLKLSDGTVLRYEWIDEMVEELVTFPFARHDDDVDAMTQGLGHLHDGVATKYLAAMRKLRDRRVASGGK